MGGSKKKQKGKQKGKQKQKQTSAPKVATENKGRFRYVCLKDELDARGLRIVTVCPSTCFDVRARFCPFVITAQVLEPRWLPDITGLARRWPLMETVSSVPFRISSRCVPLLGSCVCDDLLAVGLLLVPG